ELGLGALPSTREGFRDLVTGLDLTTESGRNAFVTLTGLSDTADGIYSGMEDAAKDAAEAAKDAAEAQQKLIASMQSFTDGIEGIKASITGTMPVFQQA